jgi:hypothetical protein
MRRFILPAIVTGALRAEEVHGQNGGTIAPRHGAGRGHISPLVLAPGGRLRLLAVPGTGVAT